MSDKLVEADKSKTLKEWGKRESKLIEGNAKWSVVQWVFSISPLPNLILAMWTETPFYVFVSIIYLFVMMCIIVYKKIIPLIFNPQPLEILSLNAANKSPLLPLSLLNKKKKHRN